MSRTRVELDDALIGKVMRLTGAGSKREAVEIALRRLVQQGNAYRALRRLRGRLPWDGNIRAWRSSRKPRR
jgi:Arc/MetJ family transcription regulator